MSALSPPDWEEIQIFERIHNQLLARHYDEGLCEMDDLLQNPYDFNDAEQEEH